MIFYNNVDDNIVYVASALRYFYIVGNRGHVWYDTVSRVEFYYLVDSGELFYIGEL